MKRRFCLISLTITAVLGMTACGDAIPNMTRDEMQSMSEYATVTMIKYDAHRRSRLVDLELVVQAEAERKEQALRQEQEEEAARAEQEASGMRPAEDTPVIDSAGVAEAETFTMEQVLNLPEGVSISYRDMEVCDSYAEEEGLFSLPATEGKKLLVLKFDLYNGSGQDQTIDILTQGIAFKVTANGNYTRRALTTMLLSDLTSYKGTVAAGSGVEAVIVMEAENSVAESISSLRLDLNNDSKTCTIQLF